MFPITVHVPVHRVEEFYIRFGEFLSETPDLALPLQLPSGMVPGWVQSEEAATLAAALWAELSAPGRLVLEELIRNVDEETAHFTPAEVAGATEHTKGASGVAGVLGGVGKAIRRAGLPMYITPKGAAWHYIWGWDGERYSMTPEMARLLRTAQQEAH